MSRMSYRWTAEQWQDSYRQRIGNLWFLNIVNIMVLLGTLTMAPQVQNGADARFFIPGMMTAVNFALCYTFLDDIKDGWFAGIACGVIFGVGVLGAVIGHDLGAPDITGPMLAVATAVAFFWAAAHHYGRQLQLVTVQARVPTRRSRRS